MKIKKSLSVVVMILALLFSFFTPTAYALSDVDFTLSVEDAIEYMSGKTVEVPIIIKTQTDNGFVDLTMFLKFDPDYLSCGTILENEVNGFTTKQITRESDGVTGLLIEYISPTGTKTQKDTQIVFTVEFSVKTGVASTETCLLSLEVNKDDVYGLDSNGNKEKGLLTISAAKDKNLTIVETHEDGMVTTPSEGDEPNFYISTTTPNPDDPGKESKGGCSAGGVIGIIFGALVVFAAGVVVGFIMCQKRLNEDGYDVPAFNISSSLGGFGRGASRTQEPERTYEDVAEQYRRSTGRSGSIYDDEIYSQRPAAPSAPRYSNYEDDEDLVDTGYFGRASDTRLGSENTSGSMLFDDDDDDDEFPSELAPRKPGVTKGGRFEDFGFLGGGRRERNDDGYGSFETDDNSTGGDDDDNGGYTYRSDRRRYR